MNPALAVLRGGGSPLVIAQDGSGLPWIVHWGADLPDAALEHLVQVTTPAVPHNGLDDPWRLSLLPSSGEGWLGTSGYAVHRGSQPVSPLV